MKHSETQKNISSNFPFCMFIKRRISRVPTVLPVQAATAGRSSSSRRTRRVTATPRWRTPCSCRTRRSRRRLRAISEGFFYGDFSDMKIWLNWSHWRCWLIGIFFGIGHAKEKWEMDGKWDFGYEKTRVSSQASQSSNQSECSARNIGEVDRIFF